MGSKIDSIKEFMFNLLPKKFVKENPNQNKIHHIRDLKIEEDDVDGISFSIDEEKTNEDQIAWDFSIMKLSDEGSRDFHKYELGYMYQIVLYKDDEAEVFETIIGDVRHYVKGLVRVNQEGLIVKKCKKSDEMMNKIFKGKYAEALKAGKVKSSKTAEAL
jgi:hypothetical protein